jgi:hypothetical protein
MSSTSRSSRGRVAVAALVALLAFGAAFGVRKATAGSSQASPMPTPLVLPSTPVQTSGVALPVVVLPALHLPPHPAAPAPSSTPTTSQPTAPAPSTTAPSTPAAPSSGGGKSSSPVLVG